jgi:DNA-binding beta-propeller fold protein YncE
MRTFKLLFLCTLAACAPRASSPAPAQSGAGTVIVANKQDNTVTLLSAADGRVTATLPVGVGPHEVAASHDGRWAVVTNYGDRTNVGSSLSLIDLRTRTVARTLPLGEYRRPHGVAFLPGDRQLVVTSEANQAVLLVDLSSGAVETAIPTGQRASHMVALSADGRRAYTANIAEGTVTEIDVAGRKQGRVLRVAPMVEGIALSPDGRQLWVGSNQAHTVSVVDTEKWEVAGTFAAPGMPYRIAFTPDGRRAVVTAPQAGVIRIIDVATRTERAAVPGASAVGVTISADGRFAYVTLQDTNQVAAVDLERGTLAGTYAVGAGPDGVAFAR